MKWAWLVYSTKRGVKKRDDKKPIPVAMELLARNYEKVLSEIGNRDCTVGFLEVQDALHETVLLLSTDRAVHDIETDDEFVRLFLYRFRMIRFRLKQNYATEIKKLKYADYLSTQEDE